MQQDRNDFGPGSDEFASWVERYKLALKAMESRIPANVKKILIEHYKAPDRRLSVLEMAQIAGYQGSRSGSLQYGKFAGILSNAMGVQPPGVDKLSQIGEWDASPDERGHGGWFMYEDLATALEELGWVVPTDRHIRRISAGDGEEEFVTERFSETAQRIGQDIFRARLLTFWKCCAVTGCDLEQVLVASHIVPWAEANDRERLDVFNGLLLTPNLDALFGRYSIAFDERGLIRIASSISDFSLSTLGIHSAMKLSRVAPEHVPYLRRHFSRFQELHL